MRTLLNRLNCNKQAHDKHKMKPQNYSLKFQNSLADSRITPGSQHGKSPISNAPKARNGHRAPRKLTKYEQLAAKRGVVKKKKGNAATLNSKVEDAQEEKERKEAYAEKREHEKVIEKEIVADLTGMFAMVCGRISCFYVDSLQVS